MAENTLLDKVLSLQDKFNSLQEQLSDPAVISDMKKFVQLNKDYKSWSLSSRPATNTRRCWMTLHPQKI